jgi:diacylglycerol kinase (ATP)
LRNQPKYSFFKNTSYALNGLKDIFKNETSFRIELAFGIFLVPFLIFIDLDFTTKVIMFISMMGVLIAETINSAIQRVVDLVTLEHHIMAKRAKDVGSTIVFLSIFVFVVVWSVNIYNLF